MSNLLQAQGLSVSYGIPPALRDVAVDVGSGAVVALLGANGAGKSTILKAIAGLVPT
jgi:branched-chain amino acid transport system ATP-binding protein